jgi:serine/threonine protein kinase
VDENVMNIDTRCLPIGRELSDYRIDGILGQGGFGITYLATDSHLGRKVAIKEYFPREFASRDSTLTVRASGNVDDRETFQWGLDRFVEEARLLAKFEHPNIIGVRRFFEANGTAYLVMDYCDGIPLDELIKRDGPLTREQLDKILYPMLDGLEQVHRMNFMHRDIKPANIYIRSDGSPVLLDFGAARQDIVGHSRSVTSLATPGYAAFEQYSTKGKQGPWTDIYGLAATLYRAVTGEKPQDSPDRILEDSLVSAVEIASGRYDERLLRAIDAGMSIRPEQRPQTIAQWRELFRKQSNREIQPDQSNGEYRSTNNSKNELVMLSENTKIFIVGIFSVFILILVFELSKNNYSTKPVSENINNTQATQMSEASGNTSSKLQQDEKYPNCPTDKNVIWDSCFGDFYDPTNNTREIGVFKNGQLSGLSILWKNKYYFIAEFESGILHGYAKEENQNTGKISYGTYLNGCKVGYWYVYTLNMQGKWFQYDLDCNLPKEVNESDIYGGASNILENLKSNTKQNLVYKKKSQ